MPRGRHPQPDAVKAAKGNPGKRAPKKLVAVTNGEHVAVPDFLTSPEEQALFETAVSGVLGGSVARATDAHAFGRWAAYAYAWEKNKRLLALLKNDLVYETDSNHGKMQRVHPRLNVLTRLEGVLTSLEASLGLTPLARQNLLRNLMAMTPEQQSLFAGGTPEKPADQAAPSTPPAAPSSPIGFVAGNVTH